MCLYNDVNMLDWNLKGKDKKMNVNDIYEFKKNEFDKMGMKDVKEMNIKNKKGSSVYGYLGYNIR